MPTSTGKSSRSASCIEAARLLENREALAWSLFNRSAVALASGDLDIALATAEESVELTRHVHEDYVGAWASVRLAAAVLESGRSAEALELLLGSAGGEELTFIPDRLEGVLPRAADALLARAGTEGGGGARGRPRRGDGRRRAVPPRFRLG